MNVGANYNAYLAMMKFVAPFKGTVETFWKLPQTVIGPEEDILWPVSSEQVSCEMELGVIIGKKIKRVSKNNALDCVFGYTVVNDVTAIDLIKRGLGEGREGLPGFFYLCLAKSFDTFESIGPCIISALIITRLDSNLLCDAVFQDADFVYLHFNLVSNLDIDLRGIFFSCHCSSGNQVTRV